VATYRFKAWLRYENARGGNIYVGMNPLKPEARGRTKRDIAAVRHLYLDLDANGTEALAAILADRTLPRPNYVLHTSIGKHQVVWNVEGFEAEQAEHLQRAMALVYGADRAATDVTRVLRIPGFNNRKYDPPYRVTAWKHADAIYIPRDFHVDLRSELSPVTQPLGEQHAVRINRTSQSERDWAETLRRLEQHESPADVQEWLMQKRRDKPYPNFYASLTVRKAIAELERRRTAKLSMEFS
jgi:predicted secreted protein